MLDIDIHSDFSHINSSADVGFSHCNGEYEYSRLVLTTEVDVEQHLARVENVVVVVDGFAFATDFVGDECGLFFDSELPNGRLP